MWLCSPRVGIPGVAGVLARFFFWLFFSSFGGVVVLFGGVFVLLGVLFFVFRASARIFVGEFFFEGIPHRNGEFPLCVLVLGVLGAKKKRKTRFCVMKKCILQTRIVCPPPPAGGGCAHRSPGREPRGCCAILFAPRCPWMERVWLDPKLRASSP